MITFRLRGCGTVVRPLALTLTLTLSALLGACGGGGSSSNSGTPQVVVPPPPPPPPPPPVTLTLEGTAAIGAPIVAGTITARCADGSGFTQAVTTGADGSWSGTIDDEALPCALQVSGGTPAVTLHSYTSAAGTINITPLTDLVLALATSQTPQDWFNNYDGSSVDIGTASGTLLDTFSGNGFDIPPTGNPFTTPFATDGSGWDGLLDDIGQAVADDPDLADYAALVALVKDGNLDILPVAPAPVTFSITGTITGASGAVGWETRRNDAAHSSGSNSNGAVTFSLPAGMLENSIWSVVVTSAPSGQSCSVTNGSGVLTANVANIAIQCSNVVVPPVTFTISGSISGATGAVQWQVLKDGGNFRSGSNSNGSVAFTTAAGMASGSAWSVQVTTPPTGQNCAVSNGSGTLTANVNNVQISCRDNTVVVPTDAVYDFSELNLKPVVPSMTPIAPVVTPVDPSLDIAALYAQLGERELARVFAPAPDNLKLKFDTDSTRYSILQSDPNSSWTRLLGVNPGADGELNTADDTISAYTVSPDGPTGVQYSFTHPGADATWFTADDIPGDHRNGRDVYFPRGTVLEYQDLSEGVILILPFLDTGDDGKLFTLDDTVNFSAGYQIALLDGEGNRGQVITYDGTGADGFWFTADDRVKNYVMVTSALTGRQVISTLYTGAGTDGRWFSGDDVLSQHTQAQLDSDYLIRYSAIYDARGGDNSWFTADDRVLSWTYYGYDEDENVVLVATHTNKGGDGIWFTADDSATGLVDLKDDNGRSILSAVISGAGAMGPDGLWLSGDETLLGYAYTGYDDNGFLILNAQMQNKGPDGKWFTGDDLPTASYNYWKWVYDAQGRITQQVYFDPALAPGSPAFSAEHISYYTVYNADFSQSVSVYRDNYGSSFGGDGKPFTADDFIPWPYTIETQSGFEQVNQPGPDGIWFTGDDVKSGSVVREFDGNRKTLEQYLDASGEVVSYSQATGLSADSYRTDSYQIDDAGTAVLTGYKIVLEDGNGYPRWTTWYTVDDEVTNVDYTEYDSLGNITRQSSSYAPGADGVWATDDDFGYYALQSFNSAGESLSLSSQYPGGDRIWGTGDDYVSLTRIEKLGYDVDALPGNIGYLARSCDDLMSASSGSINVVVRDQNGSPLAGAIAQLNSQGATSTTDANGAASFTGLSGTQDLHLFKDGYGWESFYCVAPGTDVTVQARLNKRSELAWDSKVNFQDKQGVGYFTLRLLDAEGRSMSTRSYSSSTGGESGPNYGSLHFALPVGSEVGGELWAFNTDNQGILLSAQSLGQQTHTTIASNLFNNYQELAMAFDSHARIPVASGGTAMGPGNLYATVTVSLGGLYELPFRYESSLGGNFATVPDVAELTLPELAQPTGVRASSEFWQAWYPGDYPQLGEGTFHASITTGFQYGPSLQTQQAQGDEPVLHWAPARQVRDDGFATVTTLQLRNAVGGLGYQSHWTLHVPAGNSSVQLPRLPAGISDAMLPQAEYRMVMRTRALPAVDYHTLVGTQDLHNVSPEFTTEVLTTGADYDEGRLLQR